MAKRRMATKKIALWAVLLFSLAFNVYYIAKPISRPFAWTSKSTDERVLRVMKYVELERKVDDVVQEEFVKFLWQYMKDNLTTGHLPKLAPVQKRKEFNNGTDVEENRRKFLRTKPILNSFQYSFTNDQAKVCQTENIQIIFASPSFPSNFERRMKMRSGEFGRFAGNPQNRAKLLFFVGKPAFSEELNEEPSEVQRDIDLEQSKYQDIVQATFDDVYRNIVWKGLLIPKWCSTFCPDAAFVIRVDDDVRANVFDLISALVETQQKHRHFILGRLLSEEAPSRDMSSKYFISYEEYPYKTFPPFVLGGCMGYPVKTGEILYEACRRVQPVLWLDDVWTSAMCAHRVNIPVLDSPPFHFNHGHESEDGETTL